ncbi:MAG: FdhF/YdeP family oxidoreductase [Fimbriimonadaceae bacterium]
MARYGGGWQAISYTFRKGRQVGFLKLWRAMRAKNACKTCALGMGGQQGGMVNEAGHFPEVCKKSLQAMVGDMQGRVSPEFFQKYSLAELAGLSSLELEACGRLAEPVVARDGDTHYRAVSWEEALELVARRLNATSPDRAFFYASGRSSNEAGFLLQLLARCYGTNHVSNCSYYCHQASGVGLSESIGTGTATVNLEDLEVCDFLFLIGGNPASNHPRLMTSLAKLRERGGTIVVVNPIREPGLVEFRVPSKLKSMLFGSPIASHYAQVSIGGDIAFCIGVSKALLEMPECLDRAFIEHSTEQFEQVESQLKAMTWEELEATSGISRIQMAEIAAAYATSERAIFAWTMGITHHEHGVANVQWITNLALLRGMVGKPGAGLMPIRGHSNVQGLGTLGVSPEVKQSVLDRLSEQGVLTPSWPGYDTMAAMEACERGEMDFGLCLGGNLFGANPDSRFAGKSLSALETLVYLSTSLNTGHVRGRGKTTIILPVCARDEEDQITTQESMFSLVRFSEGGPKRHAQTRTEVSIIASLGESLKKPGLNWAELSNHDEIRKFIAKIIPTLGAIQEKVEFQIPGRRLAGASFDTPTGRALFKPHPIPELAPLADSEFRLMTIRSEGQFNTVVYEEHDLYRNQTSRDIIMLNPIDIARLGLKEDQPVQVRNAVGEMVVMVRALDIAAGCAAMYYPEANELVPRTLDPRSKTPAFKNATVTIAAWNGKLAGRESILSASPKDRLNAC